MSKEKKKDNGKEEEKEAKQTEKAEEAASEKESKIEKLTKELDSKNDAYMRLAAEYDNYRKRTTAEKANIYADATSKAISEILPVADSLEMAMKSAENAPQEYTKGLELVVNQLKASLAKLNVEEFGQQGDEFNPEIHNAVSTIEDEEFGENVLAQVFQKGYKTGDKIIRHAMVQVANCD